MPAHPVELCGQLVKYLRLLRKLPLGRQEQGLDRGDEGNNRLPGVFLKSLGQLGDERRPEFSENTGQRGHVTEKLTYKKNLL